MSWLDPDEDRGEQPDGCGWEDDQRPRWEDHERARWPLDWRCLYARERWLWFEQLWSDVCALRERYRLPVRCGWWQDHVQVEALAALAAWCHRYDTGEWDDPPGKLALLFDLDRVAALLRGGDEPFEPDRDRLPFARHLIAIGCRPPPSPEEQRLT